MPCESENKMTLMTHYVDGSLVLNQAMSLGFLCLRVQATPRALNAAVVFASWLRAYPHTHNRIGISSYLYTYSYTHTHEYTHTQ